VAEALGLDLMCCSCVVVPRRWLTWWRPSLPQSSSTPMVRSLWDSAMICGVDCGPLGHVDLN
jgi:hypothetical protein